MKIILKNELEKWAWQIMLEAHYKWEKNYGDSLRQQMDWYFFDLLGDQVKKRIESEARKRVKENWEHTIGLETTLDEYLYECAEECENDGVTREELVEDYEHLRGLILQHFEDEKEAVEEDLRRLYSSLFNAPESLTVVYAQSQNKVNQKRELLQKYYEMACHNLLCCSKNYAMDQAKEGFEGEWKQYQVECEILQEMMAEETSKNCDKAQ
ncbi:MAG: hypothetical protein FH756_10685 [Firmicutes bacterium]|nr:hypothetical protein [Bacillota bacterium]